MDLKVCVYGICLNEAAFVETSVILKDGHPISCAIGSRKRAIQPLH